VQVRTYIPVTGISNISGTTSLQVGQTRQLTAHVTPTNASDRRITWTVTSGNAVTVNRNTGMITGVRTGTSTVRATSVCRPNIWREVRITVVNPPPPPPPRQGGAGTPGGLLWKGASIMPIPPTHVRAPGQTHGNIFRGILNRESSLTHSFITRASWGANSSQSGNWIEVRTKHSIVLHHTGRTNTATAIDRLHANNDWGGIGYHFLIGRNGNVYEGRPLDFVGVHTAGHNTGYIGIALAGDFEPRWQNGWFFAQEPTTAQITSLRELVGLLQRHYGIGNHRIFKHSDLNNTSCPGSRFPSFQMLGFR